MPQCRKAADRKGGGLRYTGSGRRFYGGPTGPFKIEACSGILWPSEIPKRKFQLAMKERLPMSSIKDTAERFFDACETGKGWEGCEQYCHPSATFKAQADALAGIDKLQAYTEWMKDLFTPLPDAQYEVRSFAVDETRNNVAAYGVFRGTHTGEGGPVPPTGKRIEADYVYVMQFEGDKIRHMTKIWNDAISLKQIGWV